MVASRPSPKGAPSTAALHPDMPQPNPTRPIAPLVVHLHGIERLAPPGRHQDDILAWLHAPILGAPLLRRLLEPLVGVPMRELRFGNGRAARILMAVLGQVPQFGLCRTGDGAPRTRQPDLPGQMELHLPADGVLDNPLPGQLFGPGERGWSCLIKTPHGALRSIRLITGAGSGSPAESLWPGTFWPLGTPHELIETATAALAGRIAGLAPVGRQNGDLLRGARAGISRRATCVGPATVGDESLVDHDVILGDGTCIGRRCVIGRGARLDHSVILDGAFVAPGEILSGIVRGPRGDLAA